MIFIFLLLTYFTLWRKGNPPTLLLGMQIDAATRENRFLKKQGIKLPYKPAIPLLGIYPEETINEKATSTPVLIATLFTVARHGSNLGCSLTDEWIWKLWDVDTMEYYSLKKLMCLSQF